MFELHHGDSLDVMRGMPDNSVDAVVCDPPYGLGREPDALAMLRDWLDNGHHDVQGAGFMGKHWDAFVPQPALWREALRVLKPGGHLLAFAGARTYDLMTLGLRIAGFEIRDCVMWVYGSGFPKSLDVSKAIGRQRHDRDQVLRVTAWIAEARDRAGLKNSDIDRAFGFNGMAGHWTSQKSQPAIPTLEQVPQLLELLGVACDAVPEEIAALLIELNGMKGQPGEAWFRREVIGMHEKNAPGNSMRVYMLGEEYDEIKPITAPATEAARQWEGWGTALKPAHEPVVVARKPTAGTIAQNVLRFGTGALNIDACRVEPTGESRERDGEASQERRYTESGVTNFAATPGPRGGDPLGRWPANLIHDGSDEVIEAFPVAKGQQGDLKGHNKDRESPNGVFGRFAPAKDHAARIESDTSAARFFYCAKASKADRDEGLEGFDAKPAASIYGDGLNTATKVCTVEQAAYGVSRDLRRNTHPTVKPTALMRYLVRLVTPPGGTVLDPFTGSGSTGKACMLEGFRFIGIEREAEYVEIARARIEYALAQVAEPVAAEPANDNRPAAQVWQQLDMLAS